MTTISLFSRIDAISKLHPSNEMEKLWSAAFAPVELEWSNDILKQIDSVIKSVDPKLVVNGSNIRELAIELKESVTAEIAGLL